MNVSRLNARAVTRLRGSRRLAGRGCCRRAGPPPVRSCPLFFLHFKFQWNHVRYFRVIPVDPEFFRASSLAASDVGRLFSVSPGRPGRRVPSQGVSTCSNPSRGAGVNPSWPGRPIPHCAVPSNRDRPEPGHHGVSGWRFATAPGRRPGRAGLRQSRIQARRQRGRTPSQ
jgi:hypothetical protein